MKIFPRCAVFLLLVVLASLIAVPAQARVPGQVPGCFAGPLSSDAPAICKVIPPTALCEPSTTRLCISDQPDDRRFGVTVAWSTTQGDGGSGLGKALALEELGIRRGGMFWFFSIDNPELLVKVLDGCAINGHYWIFWSAGTTVGLEVTIDDTFSGSQAIYRNVDRTAAAPVADTFAFPCE